MLQTILNNRYQIIKELGYGGFGTTYLAEDKQLDNSLCAIKRLNSDVADIEIAQKLFKREADTLLQLQEVNQVPKFIDYFEESGCNYIVEEYIEGSSLEDLVDHHWSDADIVIFLWDILSILQLLHYKNIVHRDIKPSNLIQRNQDNKFTIIDFGAVKEIEPDAERKKGTCIYSQDYSPPEQMQGVPRLNSDIYALGMTAIQLLTKEPPREIIRDHKDRVLAPKSNLAPPWLIDILNKMVRTDFLERYQSVEEVLKDLGQKNKIKPPEPPKQPNPINPSVDETPTQDASLPEVNYLKKYWYLPLIILPLLIITSEVINPWLRPKYYLHQGNNLLDNQQPKKSLAKFQQVTELQMNSAAAWKGRGDALFNLRRYSGALEAYNRALAIEPNNRKTLNNKGKILSLQKQFPQAVDTYNKAIQIDSENAQAWSGLGLAYMSLQQPDKALESFEKAQTIKPDEPNFWLQKGLVLRALQRPQEANQFYQEALEVYNEVTNKNSQDPAIWSDRGFVLLQLNRPQDAFASYDRALGIDRNFYEALIGKANVYISTKDYKKALAIFDRASEIRPKDFQVWFNRGNLLLQALNNPTEALLAFQKATTLNTNFYPAWLGQGFAFNALKQYPDAKLAFNTAIELNPQDPYAWLNLGLALEALEEFKPARDAYQKAVELNFFPAQEHLERMQSRLEF